MAFTGQVPNATKETVKIQITVNGTKRWSFENIAQADMYWAGLNIFGRNTAKYIKNGKTVAKKGEFVSFDNR